MRIRGIARGAILKAVDEFERLGRAKFLSKYGFRESKSRFLTLNGRLYDSKAIVGAAYGIQNPALGPLNAKAFSGGQGVERLLRTLGFEVSSGPDEPDRPIAR
jgi:hypothetical protein